MTLLLRIVLSPKEARRLQLEELPESVDQLIEVLKERLQLERDFTLQFEDPDFGNALCQLTTMSDLPEGRAVLHIIWPSTPSSPCNLSDHSINGSISSLDTSSVHSEDFRPSSSLQSPEQGSSSDSGKSSLRQDIKWPSPFPIPKLSYDVELKLRKGNDVYAKTKKTLEVTRDMKTAILDKLAQAIFDLRGGYPAKDEVASVASALVLKYPCLSDTDSITGCDAWLTSLRYKIGNFRAKLRDAGCNEVDVNRKRRGDGEDGPFTLKKPKRGEVNHVPDYPDHHDDGTLEEERLALVDEFKKRRRNMAEIRQKMELTFSLRRREIVEMQPMVSEVKERWPALFSLEEISEEFYRITSKNLLVTFCASLDKYALRLLKLYRARKGAFGPEMEALLDELDEETRDIASQRKTAALRGLPIFIREDTSKFFLKCLETDPEDPVVRGVSVGILTVYEDDDATRTPTVRDVAVVLEGAVILHDFPDLPTAFAYLFGLLYAINIDYPKLLRYTFEAIQTIFFELGARCSQRIKSLKNKLSQ